MLFANQKAIRIFSNIPVYCLLHTVPVHCDLEHSVQWQSLLPRTSSNLHVGVLSRYAIEKAKYEMTLKQEAPTSPPPLATSAPHLPSVVPQTSFPSATGKGKKDADAPKRPRTAYILFSMEFRKTLDNSIGFNDGTKLVSAQLSYKDQSPAANISQSISFCHQPLHVPCLPTHTSSC